jgi:hypothetical protein
MLSTTDSQEAVSRIQWSSATAKAIAQQQQQQQHKEPRGTHENNLKKAKEKETIMKQHTLNSASASNDTHTQHPPGHPHRSGRDQRRH